MDFECNFRDEPIADVAEGVQLRLKCCSGEESEVCFGMVRPPANHVHKMWF